ncbi:hypothetical protein [Limnoglobus roseus]|uniref:Uncharacterized protein n=1 Tax=Limnoglobus roseus TaxID=2598579 RepID=A0A5C1ALM2_9BACT|nr:hypothetical protein [Limnoglobus roseus]QEL18876.1 hypothetical protein PX52LOC_05918 [Limnoglobus roseus]
MARRDDDSGEFDRQFHSSRRARRMSAWAWCLIAIGGVLVVSVLTVGLLSVGRASKLGDGIAQAVVGPRPEVEGVNWNLIELSNHLASRGFQPMMYVTEGEHLEAVWRGPDAKWPDFSNMNLAQMEAARKNYNVHAIKNVKVRMFRDAKSAHDRSDAFNLSFSWGRFLFTAEDPTYLNQLQAILNP